MAKEDKEREDETTRASEPDVGADAADAADEASDDDGAAVAEAGAAEDSDTGDAEAAGAAATKSPARDKRTDDAPGGGAKGKRRRAMKKGGAAKTKSAPAAATKASATKSSRSKASGAKSSERPAKSSERPAKSSERPAKSSVAQSRETQSSGREAAVALKCLCVHCGHRWTTEHEEPRRCPGCMRKTGIEVVARSDSSPRQIPRWAMPAVAVAVLGAVVAAWVYWADRTPDTVGDDVAMRPLEHSQIRGHIRRLEADVPEDVSRFLEANEAIEDFASSAVGSGEPLAQARSVVAAIQARARARAFVPWSLTSPRDTPVRDVRATLEAVQNDGGNAQLYPLEVAALAVSALRTEGVPVMIAEIYDFEGERSPPDPSGHLGYFGVAVYPDEVGEGTPTIVDPYGGRTAQVAADDARVLDDVQVIGAVMNHRAIHRMVHEGDHEVAFALAQAALKLDRRSPSIRTVRAMVLLLSGGAEEGLAEFEAAAQLRPDAPRRNNLAGIFLEQRNFEAASREVAAALEVHPDFAGGHATLGAIHLMRDEMADVARELRTAEELDPDLPNLPMLWALYYVSTHEVERAVSKAEEALARRPHDIQTAMGAAQVFRAAGRYDDMRRQARRVLDMVPASQRAGFSQLLPRILGPTALEEPLDEEFDFEGEDDDDYEPHGSSFQLDDASSLSAPTGAPLGGGAGSRPSLLGGEEEPLLNLGEPSTLGGGGDLQLRLGE